MTLEEKIKSHKFQMYIKEIANDMYYLSYDYKEDQRILNQLEEALSFEQKKSNSS
jgi:hypothetical protein